MRPCCRAASPVDVDSDTTQDGLLAGPTLVGAACLTGTYANDAYAVLTPPPGYVVTQGTNPLRLTSASIQVAPFCITGSGGGGGGGGGCAATPPSRSAQPDGRQPDLIACT